jgi:mRNA interferase MazF
MRGKVVLVPFPYDDLSGTKVRPAAALTYPIGAYRHVVLAFISTVIPVPLLPTDLLLDPADPDFGQTGLRARSVLRLHRVMTVTTSVIRRDLGNLSMGHLEAVEERLRLLLNL